MNSPEGADVRNMGALTAGPVVEPHVIGAEEEDGGITSIPMGTIDSAQNEKMGEEGMDSWSSSSRRIGIIIAIVCIIGIVAATVTGISFGSKKKDDPTLSTNSAPDTNSTDSKPTILDDGMEEWRELLGNLTTEDPSVLVDPSSPQYMAMDWLANVDALAPRSESQLYDRYALACLYYSTNGMQWNESENYLTSAPQCEWDFVQCKEAGTLPSAQPTAVIGLEFESNKLAGRLPEELKALTSLELLNFDWNNDLTGSIPSQWYFPSLSTLYLDENQLTGTLPNIGWSSLENVTCRDNQLSGDFPFDQLTNASLISCGYNLFDARSIPWNMLSTSLKRLYMPNSNLVGTLDGISRLNFLERLVLQRNSFSASLPTELGSLDSLEWLILSFNSLSGSVPTQLGSLDSLEALLLSFNSLSGGIPTQLGSLDSLEWLDLSYNSLSGSLPTELGSLDSLEYLILSANADLTGTIPTELGLLDSLVQLDLSSNNLGGTLPHELGLLTSLEYLNLRDCFFEGSLANLGQLTQLIVLDISDNFLTGPLPTEFANATQLERLVLSGNSLSGDLEFLCTGNLTIYSRDDGLNDGLNDDCSCCSTTEYFF